MRLLRTAAALAVAFTVTAATAPAPAAAQTAVVDSTFQSLGGFRYRQANGGRQQNQLYYGISANLGAPPRMEAAGTFAADPFTFQLSFSRANNALTLSSPGFNGNAAYTINGLPGFNALRIEARQGATAGDVTVFDLLLDGTPLGDVNPEANESVASFYGVDTSRDFTLGGRIEFATPRTSGENQRVEFNFGTATPVADPSVVPEPSTYALMAGGLAGLAGVARRRRQTRG